MALEQEIRASVRRLKEDAREQYRKRAQTAVDYLEGRLEADTQSELYSRFPSSQDGEAGQEILPITLGLVERYVSEAANAYNRPVKRELVDEEGGVNDDLTKILADELDIARYDEVMHRAEQLSVLLGMSCVWFQAKRGALRPAIVLPQDIYPIAPEAPDFFDPSDPEDYEAFVVELFWAVDDDAKAQRRTFAHVSRKGTVFYEGSEPHNVDRVLSEWPNPYLWPQALDGGKPTEQPGQMLTFWHDRLPLGGILPDRDHDIVEGNREINIALSAIFDNIRFQGHAVPVKKLINPSDPKAKQRHGVRFPVVLDLSESFEYITSATNYADQVQVLKDFVRLLAMAKRMSPNDFSIDGAAPASGFAKLVDSLPKLEARNERVRRLKHLEEQVAAPRILSVLVTLGKLPREALGLRMRVTFPEIEFPTTEQEKTARVDREIKIGLTTAAEELAKRNRISVSEAENLLESRQEQIEAQKPQPQAGPPPGASGFGSRIGMTARPKVEREEKEDDGGKSRGPTPRRDR